MILWRHYRSLGTKKRDDRGESVKNDFKLRDVIYEWPLIICYLDKKLYLAGLQMELYAAAAERACGEDVAVRADDARWRLSADEPDGEPRFPIPMPLMGWPPPPPRPPSNGESRDGVELGETLEQFYEPIVITK